MEELIKPEEKKEIFKIKVILTNKIDDQYHRGLSDIKHKGILPKGKRGSWIAYADTPLYKLNLSKNAPEWAMSASGWNNSYHDAAYSPVIAAYGSSPSRARKRLKQLLKSEYIIKEKEDTVQKRFAAKRQVREGD